MNVYTLHFDDTPVGTHRYEECLRAIRTRANGAVKEPSFEDQRKEGRLVRKFRAIGVPKDFVGEVQKALDAETDERNLETLRKLLDKLKQGDDPRVAEPEAGMPDTRDFVLAKNGGSIEVEFDDRELLVKYLKATRWFPDWAEFGQDLVEYLAGVQPNVDGETVTKPRLARGSK